MKLRRKAPKTTNEAVSLALDAGVEQLLHCLRPGPLSQDGRSVFGQGWHDFYEEENRTAGAHATLEGFLLCKHKSIAKRIRFKDRKFNPNKSIFEGFLIPLFGRTEEDGWPLYKEDQRAEAEVTTTKIAKFAQCCYYDTNHERKLILAQNALDKLSNSQRENSIEVGHSIYPNTKVNSISSYASADNLRAKYLWAKTDKARIDLLKDAAEYISPANHSIRDNPWLLEDIPWLRDKLPILTAVYTTCVPALTKMRTEDETRSLFKLVFESIIKHDYFTMGDLVTETYSFRDHQSNKQRTDYVSFETTLSLISAVLSSVKHGIASPFYIHYIQPTLLAWRGGRVSGYCSDVLTPNSILPQKNRFSYLTSILRALILAEEVLNKNHLLLNQNLPMYVNPTRFSDRGIVPDGSKAFLATPFKDDTQFQNLESKLRVVCSRHKFDLCKSSDIEVVPLTEPGPGGF